MRAYPQNSPQAAGRIVALTMLADGCPAQTELAMLEALDVYRELGLTRLQWNAIVHGLCEDLLAYVCPRWSTPGWVQADMLEPLLAELDDAELKHKVLWLCIALAIADRQLTQGELTLLLIAAERWRVVQADPTWWRAAHGELSAGEHPCSRRDTRLGASWIALQIACANARARQRRAASTQSPNAPRYLIPHDPR